MCYVAFPKPPDGFFKAAPGETEKYRHLTSRFCEGAGVDIASQGAPVVPWAISFDLPEPLFFRYSGGRPPRGPIHLRGDAAQLPFDSGSLDFVYSSHLLEDYTDWLPLLREWVRVLRPGGNLIILLPDAELWEAAVRAGQPPNTAHRHEARVGELSGYAAELGLDVVEDRRTLCYPGDYSILFVGRRKRL